MMVNDTSIFRVDHMPYGGNRMSGIGREGVRFAVEEMTNLRLVCFNSRSGLGTERCATDGVSPRTLQEDPPVAARDERRDVGEDARQREAAGIGQIARLPDRVELLLVGAQPLEVVERLAVAVDEAARPSPRAATTGEASRPDSGAMPRLNHS